MARRLQFTAVLLLGVAAAVVFRPHWAVATAGAQERRNIVEKSCHDPAAEEAIEVRGHKRSTVRSSANKEHAFALTDVVVNNYVRKCDANYAQGMGKRVYIKIIRRNEPTKVMRRWDATHHHAMHPSSSSINRSSSVGPVSMIVFIVTLRLARCSPRSRLIC